MAAPIEHLFLLIIAPGSQMLLEHTVPAGIVALAPPLIHLSLPRISYVTPPALLPGAAAVPIHGQNVLDDQTNIQGVLQAKITTTPGLNNLGVGIISRFNFCNSFAARARAPVAPPGVAVEDIPAPVAIPGGGGIFAPYEYCVVLRVNDAEKNIIQAGNPNLRFHQTYCDIPVPARAARGVTRAFNTDLNGLNLLSRRMFNSFNYDEAGGRVSVLDQCIRTAVASPAAIPAASVPSPATTITYRFFRPVFPLFSLPYIISPFGSPYGSPRTSPRFSGRAPERRPSPSSSPVVARMRKLEEEYHEKYLKYKAKYMKLKAQLG